MSPDVVFALGANDKYVIYVFLRTRHPPARGPAEGPATARKPALPHGSSQKFAGGSAIRARQVMTTMMISGSSRMWRLRVFVIIKHHILKHHMLELPKLYYYHYYYYHYYDYH